MKTSRIVILGILLFFPFHQLFSQAENQSIIKKFGIGLHIEQFKIVDMTDLVFAPANKIIFTISPSNVFRIEPEIGYRGGKNKNSDLKYSSLYFGLGAFGMMQRNKLNIHYGVRVEYAILKEEDNVSTGFGSSKVEYQYDRILAGPALGCEYYLGENFAFGGELALKYGLLKSTIDPKPTGYKDGESTYFTTDTGLFIRFYFGK